MISRQTLLIALVGMSFKQSSAMMLMSEEAQRNSVASAQEEKKLRAFEALSQESSQAFAQVVVGCCELDENVVPLALFREVLEKNPDLTKEVNPLTFLSYSGVPFGNYFQNRLVDSQSQARTAQVIAEWKKLSMRALVDFVDFGRLSRFY